MRAKFYIYQPWLTLVARLILGGVLLAAGGLKIGNLQKSAMAVRAYEMLPVGVANFLGYVLPWIEIGLGLPLIELKSCMFRKPNSTIAILWDNPHLSQLIPLG